MADIARARFIVEYTTNLTGNRKFILKNEKNIEIKITANYFYHYFDSVAI